VYCYLVVPLLYSRFGPIIELAANDSVLQKVSWPLFVIRGSLLKAGCFLSGCRVFRNTRRAG
jgi:hypothetical protein